MNKSPLYVLLSFFLIASCQKDRKIGGRVFDKETGDPLPNVLVAVSTTSSGGGATFVVTNSSGYYAVNPDDDRAIYEIQVVNPELAGPNGGYVCRPRTRTSFPNERSREYDFFLERKKRLVVQLADTINYMPGKNYQRIYLTLYSKIGGESGTVAEIDELTNLDSLNTYINFSTLGWFYATGYVKADNSFEPFHDSIFVKRPLDGIDTLKIYF